VRLFCVCVVLCVGSGLATADHSSKESYRLHKEDHETEEEARTQQRSVEPLMFEMNEFEETVLIFAKCTRFQMFQHVN
jgi:hypothetical protein